MPEELNGLHLTLTGLGTFLGVVASAGGIYRFLILPRLQAARDEMQSTQAWRRKMDIRITLLEQDASADVVSLRSALLED